ncbi:MAG: sterol desaturase family protein, partial [Actinomycetota bacterium]|nr:sterol desaturase family protein [Actinomycetota bacterium]
AAVGAEVAWLARRPGAGRRNVLRSAATASAMAFGALVVGVVYTVALRFLWGAVATLQWDSAARLWETYPVLGVVATFIAWDFSGWIYHVIGHRTRVGWAAHQAHHSGTSFDATLGLRQSWAPFHGLLHHPLLALLGFDLRSVFVCAAISNCWQVLEHTSAPIRFPRWFSAVVMTPAAHRHHHGREGGLVNMGPFFTFWDRLAGTWVPAQQAAPALYGPATAPSRNPFAVEFGGWLHLLPLRATTKNPAWRPSTKMLIGRKGLSRWPSATRLATESNSTQSSTTTIAIQPPSAPPDPVPALYASTQPPTAVATQATSAASATTRNMRRRPPSRETDSASIGAPI